MNGLRPTQRVFVAATEEYFADQDMTGEWLANHCVVDPANPYRKATTQDLFGSWSSFARADNEPIGSLRTLQSPDQARLPAGEERPDRDWTPCQGFVGIELRHDLTRGARYD